MIPNCQADQEQESLRLPYQQIQKEKSLDEGSLIGSYEFLTLKDPIIFFNNSFKSGRENSTLNEKMR